MDSDDPLDILLAQRFTPEELAVIEAEAVVVAAARQCPGCGRGTPA